MHGLERIFPWTKGDRVSGCMFLVTLAHDLTRDPKNPPNGGENCQGNGTPAISGKSRLVKYCNLARCLFFISHR